MPDSVEQAGPSLAMQLHAGMEVLKSQQSEINRRIGVIERQIDGIIEPERILALEKWMDEQQNGKTKWSDWFWQAIVWVGAITLAVAVGNFIGVELKW